MLCPKPGLITIKTVQRVSIFLALLIWPHTSFSSVLVVPPPPASIQTYINLAVNGDTVQLSNGTYVEEILITKNITLKGNGIGISIIQCPNGLLTNSYVFTPTGGTYHPFVMVQNATVTIQDLTVDGNSQASNFQNYRFVGIGYHNANGTVQDVRATNVQDSSPGGPTQHGFAIAGAIDDSNPHLITVQNCTVDNFQKAGIDMRGNTLTVNILNNTVTGETPSSFANANGIVVQFGAKAIITGNTVTNLLSTVSGNDSAGILLNNAGANCSLSSNNTNANDLGIFSNNAGSNLSLTSNTSNTNTDIGIYVQDTNGLTTIQSNILSNNVNYNLYIYDSAANQPFHLDSNQFLGSQIGFAVQGNTTTGPNVTMDSDAFTNSAVYYIQEIAAPNDIWPSTATVTFDGLRPCFMTPAEYAQVSAKIYDKADDASLGLVIDTCSAYSVEKEQYAFGNCGFTSAPISAHVGDTIYYRVTLTNTLMGDDLTFTITDPTCLPSTGVVGPLSPGDSVAFYCSHTLTSADLLLGTYLNQADVVATAGEISLELFSNIVVATVLSAH